MSEDDGLFQVVFPDYWRGPLEAWMRTRGFELSADCRAIFGSEDDPPTYIPQIR